MAAREGAGRVSERVYDHLRREILEGRLTAGGAVPSERLLAEDLGVNRHAVREALKRLQQAGLVQITHGGATRVLDWRESGGLPVLIDLLEGGSGEPPAEIARSVLEMRASIGIDAARLCAARASQEHRWKIEQLAQRSVERLDGDPEALDEAYVTLWHRVVLGSENIAYRLSYNSLMQAFFVHREMATQFRPTDPEPIRELGRAIGAGEPGAAAAAADELLSGDPERFG